MEQLLRRTWAEIDLDALEHNFKTLQAHVGEKVGVVGVVKADAYGHGMACAASVLGEAGCGFFAVSSEEEAVELRRLEAENGKFKRDLETLRLDLEIQRIENEKLTGEDNGQA